jgi:hypothetical protein
LIFHSSSVKSQKEKLNCADCCGIMFGNVVKFVFLKKLKIVLLKINLYIYIF